MSCCEHLAYSGQEQTILDRIAGKKDPNEGKKSFDEEEDI